MVLRKRAIRRYVMIALAMGTIGFLVMLVEEMLDYSDEDQRLHHHAPYTAGQGGAGARQGLSPDDIKRLKHAADMLGVGR